MDPSDDAAAKSWSDEVDTGGGVAALDTSEADDTSSLQNTDSLRGRSRNESDADVTIGGGTAGSTTGTDKSSTSFDLSKVSLFPSLLTPSPHHHAHSHSIVLLSAAEPSSIRPSPLLSDSPSLQPTQLASDHILNNPNLIVNVWQSNLQEELARILCIVDDYPFIAMDTEFPGIVARPAGSHKTSPDYQYQTLRTNVDLLKIIQLGLCFCDAQGNIHPGTCTWQFNFQFSLTNDMYAQDSIDLLAKSGIDFNQHEKNGINPADFAEWLMTSGIVLNEDVKWISFHSGFDFGYLMKLLTCQPLPAKEDDFFALLQLYFPCIYDIKYLMDACNNLHGGLSKIAETLNVIRIGPQHQAGSDSLLTAATYFKLKDQYFNKNTNPVWNETAENRNAVYREMKVSTSGIGATYSVITNTDPLNEFDTKFMGHLAGLNNDFTSDWKKRQEAARQKRAAKDKSIAAGEAVSSDDEDWEDSKPVGGSLPPSASLSSSASTTASSSPNFVPSSSSAASGVVQPSYLPITPQKPSGSPHHPYHHSPSPQADHYTSSKLTPNKSMHRNHRYSNDYS